MSLITLESMNHVPVQSSNIVSVAYDPLSLILEVQFKGTEEKPGSRYQYFGVLPVHHQQLMEAESIGKHFHSHIKGKYEWKKIEEPKPDAESAFAPLD